MLYKVTITEEYNKTVGIEAGSEAEAGKIALEAWQSCDRALDQPVLESLSINAVEVSEEDGLSLKRLSEIPEGFMDLPESRTILSGKMLSNNESQEKNDISGILSQAEQGDVSSMARAGKVYYIGDGIEKDLHKAFMWLSKAAEKEDSESAYYAGLCIANIVGAQNEKDGDYARAADVLRKRYTIRSAELGYAPAQYEYGCTFNYCSSSRHEWVKKAADQGYPPAVRELGELYLYSCNMDAEKGKELLEKAARLGDTSAMKYFE